MAEPSPAVFLSYTSQDAGAARRIVEALRAAGIEVWFDQSELRGGDAWDHHIRDQIRRCALFIPIISASSQARAEGYFRREWKLAVDRTNDMSHRVAFLLPVVIDDTSDATADVPDRFKEVQWTRLPGGDPSTAFVERVSRLTSPQGANATVEARSMGGALPEVSRVTAASSGSRVAVILVSVIAAFAVIGVGLFLAYRFVLPKSATGRDESVPTTAAVQSLIPEKSVAVLPFVDLSEKRDQEYFSDGLAEELLDLLAQIPDLRVPARTSSFYFKGKQATIAQIAEALHVANLLEGSVRRSGKTVRVTVQLIRADTGYHQWSKTFDRDVKDIFKVQDEIAAAVVEALKVQLAPAPSAAYRTPNPQAYDYYLLGHQLNDRDQNDDRQRAIEALRKAIALDPKYAVAYADLAVAEFDYADWNGDAAGLEQSKADAEHAVTLAPQEADVYAVRGSLRYASAWDMQGAQADFAKALTLNPTDADVQYFYARFLGTLGRLPEAIATMRKAIERDPLSSEAWSKLAWLLIGNGDMGAADAALRRALEIRPDSVHALYYLGSLQMVSNHANEALIAFGKIDVSFAFRSAGLAMAEHSLHHAKESKLSLDDLIANEATVAAYQIAEVYSWRAEKQLALDWLERAYAQRDGGLSAIKFDPLLASVREEPRYRALLRKMYLPE